MGAGLWPFALSIVLFSLVIDYIGYGRSMVFAWVCHLLSATIMIMAKDYTWLYVGSFIGALANGTVEAVINPVVATMFPREKTKWLNILHAGWPGGLVIGGLMTILMATMMGADSSTMWRYKIALIYIPVIAYGILLLGKKFPVHERVAAGVSYHAMLKEVGILGALIVISLMTFEVGRVFELSVYVNIGIIVLLTGLFGAYVRSLGQPLFVFMLLIMMPLATTELGTDTWITDLMTVEMQKLSLNPGWVLVYTSFIMMMLRFSAGPIVHKLSPLGLLATCAAIAALGLTALSMSTGIGILLAATLYGVGKTFFWPTMLGVVAERFPKGGALTLNSIAGVGMLSVGIVGTVFLGYFQDSSMDGQLKTYDEVNKTSYHANYITQEKTSIFGKYVALDQTKVDAAPEAEKQVITEAVGASKKGALQAVAIFPCIMLVCYLILIFYFKTKGGYSAVHIDDAKHE